MIICNKNNIYNKNSIFAINKNQRYDINFKGIQPLPKDVFEKHKTRNIEVKYGTLNYDKNNKFLDFKFKKPENFKKTLEILKYIENEHKISRYGLLTYNHIYKAFLDDLGDKFKNMKFVSFLGVGNNAIALENTEGKVLKLTYIDTFSYRHDLEDFDAKIYERGQGQRFHYYIQEKCLKENITQADVEKMTKLIEKQGYTAFDMSTDQIAYNKEGKLCLIDPECARDEELYKKELKRIAEWNKQHGVDEYDF